MSFKEAITIKVPVDVAEAYRNATEEEREQIAARLTVMMRSTREEALNRLWQTMDKISNRAAERGLTPEILESILNDPK